MKGQILPNIQVFDPQQDFAVVQRRLPHWSQPGTVAFLTWRTWDSIPAKVLQHWQAELAAWLKQHGIDRSADTWYEQLESLGAACVRDFKRHISDRWNDHLDACHGDCVLRRSDLATIVAHSLLHFDGQRYELTDFVVMPNHVHVLAAFPEETSSLSQCESWKHFTARKINSVLRRKGRFWQQDGFDHLVRSVEQFEYLRHYLADNPRRAKLNRGEFIHWSKSLDEPQTTPHAPP